MVEEVSEIEDSSANYFDQLADKEAIRDYLEQQTQNAVNSGSRSSGQTKVLNDGSIQKISPYNANEVIQVETFEANGSIHYTTINTATNTRHSYTVTANGHIVQEHSTNQSASKGSKGRHK